MKKITKFLSKFAFAFSAVALAGCVTEHTHNFGAWTVVSEATCTEAGSRERICECGKKETETIDALGHDYKFSEIKWTNYTAKAIYTCSHDATHKVEYACEVTSEVTTAQSCENKGVKTYTATYDGHTSTKPEDLGYGEHNYGVWIDEVPATKNDEGVIGHYHCSVCGKNFDAGKNELTSLSIAKLTSKTFSITAATDSSYLNGTNTSGVAGSAGEEHRFADNTNSFTYKFDFEDEVSNIELTMRIENQSKVEVSYDGLNFYEIANSISENANGVGKYYSNVNTVKTHECYENDGNVWVRFSDADTSDGFGVALYSLSIKGTWGEGKEAPVLNKVISFTAGDADASYLQDGGNSGNGGTHRWADNNNFYMYKLDFGQSVSKVKLELVVQNDTKIDVSYDGNTFYEVANSLTENANNCGRYFSNVTTIKEFDAYENTGIVYVKFSDAKPEDSFGADLISFKAIGTFGTGKEAEKAPVTKTIEFAVENDDSYLDSEYFGGKESGATKRFVDNDHYFIYKVDFEAEVTEIVLDLIIENESKVEVSFDAKATWTQVLNSVEENANNNGRYFSNVTTTKTITADSNNGEIYFRFSDADTATGFGCALYSFKAVATMK